MAFALPVRRHGQPVPALFVLGLGACSPSPQTIAVQGRGDPTQRHHRLTKLAALDGAQVLFAQTYSCDGQDC
ncbi:hypothetical protein [Deinococcus hohokamensis]|uniref:Uncharacterized protein n=1 Tax=Deinococcus hohokamensis TaxID=309883 RepID=A0ABV9I7N0_9DEIO